MHRLLLVAIGLGSLFACSPVARVKTRVVFPPNVTAVLPASVMATETRQGRTEVRSIVPNESSVGQGVVDLETHHSGIEVDVSLEVWVDANGSGARDAGDLTGAVGPVRAIDHGLCRGNVTRAPDLILTPIP